MLMIHARLHPQTSVERGRRQYFKILRPGPNENYMPGHQDSPKCCVIIKGGRRMFVLDIVVGGVGPHWVPLTNTNVDGREHDEGPRPAMAHGRPLEPRM